MSHPQVRLRRVLVHEPYETGLGIGLGHSGNRDSGYVALGPIAEGGTQQGQHVGLLEIAGHAEDDAVGMNGPLMKGHQIFTGNRLDRTNRRFTGARMGRAVEQLGKLPPDDRAGTVLPPPDAFQRLQFR